MHSPHIADPSNALELPPSGRDSAHRVLLASTLLLGAALACCVTSAPFATPALCFGLVDLSRIEAQRMRIEMEVIELAPLLADLGAVMDVLLAGRDVTFRMSTTSGAEWVHADPDRLKQIVSNLLVNAVKFTEHGQIMLEAAPATGGGVAISVSDTGLGIPPADQRLIFEPFRQGPDRARRAPGAGIGLAISYRLAALMHASLGVESTPGAGSRFTLVVESAEAGSTPDERESPSQSFLIDPGQPQRNASQWKATTTSA